MINAISKRIAEANALRKRIAGAFSSNPAPSSRRASMDEEDRPEPVSLEHRDGFDLATYEDGLVRVVCHDSAIEGVVVRVLGLSRDDMDEETLEVEAMSLVAHAKAIGRLANRRGDDQLLALSAYIKELRMVEDPNLSGRIAKGELLSDELPIFFRKGMEVCSSADGEAFAGTIRGLRRGVLGDGTPVYFVSIGVVTVGPDGPADGETVSIIPIYAGMRQASILPVKPLDDETRARLADRGRAFRDHAGGVHFRQHATAGRIVIDPKGASEYARISGMPSFVHGGCDDDDECDSESAPSRKGIEDAELHLCWPRIQAFSLRSKRWLAVDIARVSPIAFRKDAFEQLVLDAKTKTTFKALVQHHQKSFKDIVDGKSGGVIVLLHGPAGVGKTLSAEATAEILERPLYTVSVGELGTDPNQLEQNLMRALHMTQPWGAVVLLDEADVFLEKRDNNDVFRNAMVAVFLRVLEYHDGVMFLTTNRVKEFDPAFHSRISLALRYDAMGPDTRQAVWGNLLASAGIEDIDAAALSRHDLNGRQIKNCIRLAQTLASADDRAPIQADLEDVVGTVARFVGEVADNHS